MVKDKVTLTKEERELVMVNTIKRSHTVKKVIHSLILLNVDQGPYTENLKTNEEFSKLLKIGMRTIDRVEQLILLEGLDTVLGVVGTSRVYRKKN